MATRTGTEGNDRLKGTDQADTFQAQEGDDRLIGKGGADVMSAGRGNDVVLGGRGADTLKDGFGEDRLIGGRGADVFEFVRAEGLGGVEKDVVVDYRDGQDRIDVSQITQDFSEIRIRDGKSGDVRIKIDDRLIILKDRDDSLSASDLTIDDFLL